MTAINPWVILLTAGLLEIGWALGLTQQGTGWRIATLACLGASFWLLAIAVRDLPIGTAYAVWTGIGAVGTSAFGMVFFNEPSNAGRLACLAFIIIGIIGLKVGNS